MSDYILLTKDNVHDQTIASFETKEDFFSDGRSYVAEVWDSAGIGMVTYYFSAKGFKIKDVPVENDIIECSDDTNQAMLDYLISEHKLTEKDPRKHIETVIYYVEGESVFSVSVAVAGKKKKNYREYEL